MNAWDVVEIKDPYQIVAEWIESCQLLALISGEYDHAEEY